MAEALVSKSANGKNAEQTRKPSREPARQGASIDPYAQVLSLQRSVGNRVVGSLLESGFSALPSPAVLQRKCAACDESGGECRECREQSQTLQRASLHPSEGKQDSNGEAPSIVRDVLRSPGQPLDRATRAMFEPRFGRDFSNVRVHTDTNASKSAQAVNALAYTVGREVVFANERYAPETSDGQKLLAHELTHVVQQSQGQAAASPMTSRLEIGAAFDPHEREAEQMAERVIAGRSAEEGIARSTAPVSSSTGDPNISVLHMKPSLVVMRAEGETAVEEYKKPGWVSVNKLGIVRVEEADAKQRGARLRPMPSTDMKERDHLDENTKVFVVARNPESKWIYVNVPSKASFGYIADHLVWMGLPDPDAQLFYVAEKGMGLQKLIESPEHYKLKNADYLKDYISTGDDARSLVMAIYMANEQDSRTQGHVYINQEKLKEAQNPGLIEGAKDKADDYRRVLRPIMQSVEVMHGKKIWIPGEAYIRSLKDKNIIPTRPEWKNVAIASVKAGGGFLSGLVDGFFSSIIEVFTGIYDLIKSIISFVSDLLTGDLIKQAKEVYDLIQELSGEELLKMVKEAVTTVIDEILAPFKKAWNSKNVYEKWYFWGKLVGYILAEVLMAIFTGGAANAAKWLGKLGKLGGKLIKILKAIFKRVDDLLDKVPGRKRRKEAAKHDTKQDKDDGSDKAKQLPLALTMASAIAESNDTKDSPVPVVLGLLLPLKTQFKWIKKFDADKKSPSHYKILMYASPPHVVDDDYTTKDEPDKDNPKETKAPHNKEAFEEWSKGLEKKTTPINTDKDRYEVKHTGPDNFRVKGGGEKVWADGIRSDDGFALDTKHVGNPKQSPFIEGSKTPDFVRENTYKQIDDEFRRYGAVINDAKTPIQGLEVITNHADAVIYFEKLMLKHNIPGRVIVKQ